MMNNLTGSCIMCNDYIHWHECPTGGWWIHTIHPDDHHDADAGHYPEQEWDGDGVYGIVNYDDVFDN